MERIACLNHQRASKKCLTAFEWLESPRHRLEFCHAVSTFAAALLLLILKVLLHSVHNIYLSKRRIHIR